MLTSTALHDDAACTRRRIGPARDGPATERACPPRHDRAGALRADEAHARIASRGPCTRADKPLNVLERIELLSTPAKAAKLNKVTIEAKGAVHALDFRYVEATQRIVVRAPLVAMAEDWKMEFTFTV